MSSTSSRGQTEIIFTFMVNVRQLVPPWIQRDAIQTSLLNPSHRLVKVRPGLQHGFNGHTIQLSKIILKTCVATGGSESFECISLKKHV